MEILLKANSVEGITVESLEDYPEAEILSFADFRAGLKGCGESDIFTMIMPRGTNGYFEILNDEYGIR